MQSVSVKRRRLPWWGAAGVAMLVGAGLWSAAWFWASVEAARALDGWIAAEAAAGRTWSCPERRVEGYPLSLTVRCARPTFRGEVAGRIAAGDVESLVAGAGLSHPGSVLVDLGGPLTLRADDDSFSLIVSWAAMTVTLDGWMAGPPAGAVEASRLAATLLVPASGDLNLRAAHLSGRAGPVPSVPTDRTFGFAAEEVSFPTADPIPDLPGPLQLSGDGVLSRVDLLPAPTARNLDAWRAAGGTLRLDDFRMRKGPFTGSAAGTLGLDDGHRAAGRLDTSLAGFDAVARRYGIPLAGVQIGGLLSTLLGGGKPAKDPPGRVRLPLTLADGRVAIGPFTTGLRLVPWY